MDFTIVKVTTNVGQEILEEYYYKYFYPDYPLASLFGVEKCRPATNSVFLEPGDLYLKAVDSKGEIIGIATNKAKVKSICTPNATPEIKEYDEFFEFLEEKAHIQKLPEKTIELDVLCVRQEWRKQGVGRKLVEESMKVAREAGFKAMKIGCASEFTAKLARRLGWREHYRLAYKDYPRLSGTDICLKPTPPHEHYYYYVTDLH